MTIERQTRPQRRNEFLRALVQGAAIGATALALTFGWLHLRQDAPGSAAPAAAPAGVQAPASGPLADFAGTPVSEDVRLVANWSFFTRDNQGKSVVVLDKKAATVYAFEPSGRLAASTPALLGQAVGDESAPGIGDKPLSQVRLEEKTTAAGRFVAEPGRNASGEDIVWIDYDAALSMHRVRTNNPAEHRLERLASPDVKDRRISYGCINLPASFYDRVLSPTVAKTGAIVYVLPETRTVQEVFGAWDVTRPGAAPPLTSRVAAAH